MGNPWSDFRSNMDSQEVVKEDGKQKGVDTELDSAVTALRSSVLGVMDDALLKVGELFQSDSRPAPALAPVAADRSGEPSTGPSGPNSEAGATRFQLGKAKLGGPILRVYFLMIPLRMVVSLLVFFQIPKKDIKLAGRCLFLRTLRTPRTSRR